MSVPSEPAVVPVRPTEESTETRPGLDAGYLVVVWDDPVNFMDYVTHVFMKVFGWDRAKAEKHMLEVHQKGKSVVAHGAFEKAEAYVHQLQGYHLQATMEKAG